VSRYRKKPVVIEARRVEQMGAPDLAEWCGGRCQFEHLVGDDGEKVDVWTGIVIPTLEGSMLAQPDDWIIRGVAGEFYPCKPDIFAATYEPADPSDA
jgi:hypothetical protein